MSAIKDNTALARTLLEKLTPLSWEARLTALSDLHDVRIVCSTSFGLEDQLITQAIAVHDLPVDIFTLDTGRLFEETYDVWHATRKAYPHLSIRPYYPNAKRVEALVETQGINGFYDSVAARKACCHVRKVEPLDRALSGADVWVSGLRAEQSAARDALPVVDYDVARNIVKIYPLIDVDIAAVQDEVAARDVPYNALHDVGYPSIGCAPCTRAVERDDDMRSGRWWWEQGGAQECGLHLVNGKLVRREAHEHVE